MAGAERRGSPLRWAGLILLGMLLFTAATWLAFFWFVTGPLCGNQVVQELPSPGAPLVAVVFRRDCGATTAVSTQVSILARGATLQNRAGNAFVADSNHGAAPEAADGGPELRVEWAGAKNLRVVHDPRARVFQSKTHVNGVDIDYETVKSDAP